MNKLSVLMAAGVMIGITLFQDPKPEQDLRAFSLAIAGDGSVTLKVREGKDREEKTYRAKSLEDFKKQYPEIAEKYHLDVVSDGEKAPVGKDFDVWKRWL